MSMTEQLKKAADQSASGTRETLRKGEAKAQQTLDAAREGFEFAGDSTRQMSLKLIEIVRASTQAFCSFAEDVVNERDPTKLAGIWMKHTQDQIELLSRQGQELASLGQSITSAGVNTMSDRAR
jgi:Phasin protein